MFCSMNIDEKNIRIIQIRIIDLTNKKISLDKELRDVLYKLETCQLAYMKKELNKDRRIIIDKIVELEKILDLNKKLLSQTNEHEYQLEC